MGSIGWAWAAPGAGQSDGFRLRGVVRSDEQSRCLFCHGKGALVAAYGPEGSVGLSRETIWTRQPESWLISCCTISS